MTDNIERDIMDVNEVAELLGCSEYTIRKMTRHKVLPHFRVGNRIKFSKSTLLKWIALEEKKSLKI